MTIKVTYNVTDVYVTQDVSPVYINVSYSSGGGSGAAVWGGITGTLSNQTDLQTALDGKFDDPTGTSLQYIDGTGALQTFPLTLPVLQEVRNQTGATLDAGTVVYINGATGNKPTVTKAIATGDATSAQTLGMVSAAIANNGTGYVVVIGTCSGLDTSAFTEGQQLYLSYTTAGAVTTTKPYAPYHLVYIGIVTRAHPTLGTVEVRVQNGYELDEIHDVDALNPNNNDGLFYNSTTSLWEHKQISTALGYTPANAATTLTINGVTYDLSANRSWTISAGISGSGASGQVAYWTGASAQSGSNNLFWDNANTFLGVGTSSYTDTIARMLVVSQGNRNPIEQRSYSDFIGGGTVYKRARGTFASPTTVNSNDYIGAFEFLGHNGTNFQAAGIFALQVDGTPSSTSMPGRFSWHTTPSGSNAYTEKMRLTSGGNLMLQNGGTFTDSGERLQVTGTMKVTGATTISSTNDILTLVGGSTRTTFKMSGTAGGYTEVVGNGTDFYFTTNGNTNISFITNNQDRMRMTGSTGNLLIGTITDIASSLVTMNSTTKGFLPPRMTTTQKNAISSPAAGLVVYDTTLAKLCVYTTAWETITSI